MEEPLIELKEIKKLFPGVVALDHVNLQIYRGEIHGLLGENGAGKSTLIKILTGAYQPDGGQMFLEGKEIHLSGPQQAIQLGLTAIYQELNVIPLMAVWENIYLGRELKKPNGTLDVAGMKKKSRELIARLHQNIDINSKMEDLGMGQKQMIEICKALSLKSKLIIMDEPTSSLSEGETEELMRITKELREEGLAIIFISHRMNEIFRLCDRVTILRDGQVIKSLMVKDTNNDELIRLMVGRNITQQFPKVQTEPGDVLLEVRHLNSPTNSFRDISFKAKGGEILGFSGLVGAGRTELMRAIFGVDPKSGGDVYVKGKKTNIRNPKNAIDAGIAFITEDRKGEGLILPNSVEFNINLNIFDQDKKGFLLNNKSISRRSEREIDQLDIKTPSKNTAVNGLSGGNQQKVVIAKWLESKADIFIMDEPTRGLDVGAKLEVYNIMNDLVQQGKAVIMVSSEMPEVLGMSDRIIVMHEGEISGEFSHEGVNQEMLMKAATGGK